MNACRSSAALLIGILISSSASTQSEVTRPLRIYLDADRTRATAAGDSIERGIRVALDEVGYRLGDRPVELIELDHRSSTPRSRKNLLKAANDPRGLLVFAGMHSPPLLKWRKLIHEKRLPVLVPWAAAGPITRFPSEDNCIFRLSIDDTKAGFVIAHHAVRNRNAKSPVLLLEDTGWGESNYKVMSAAIEQLGLPKPAVKWFNWGIGAGKASDILRSIYEGRHDVILLVANAPESKIFVHQIAQLPEAERIPICSHWGLTGGDFEVDVPHADREACQLQFLQTRFSFLDAAPDSHGTRVFAAAKRLFPDLKKPADLRAPTGFVHAYDLTRVLIEACRDLDMHQDIEAMREALRHRLESIDSEVVGLLKTYRRPFRQFSVDDPDAHEALDDSDFAMGRYREDGAIELIDSGAAKPPK